MAYWLLKTEPGDYSFSDLQKEGTTVWDGITSNFALKFLRTMQPGDQVMIYHSGKGKNIVGLAEVVSQPYPDPAGDNPRLLVVDIKAGRALNGKVSLGQLRGMPEFSDFLLLKNSRLSVIPVPDDLWKRIIELDG